MPSYFISFFALYMDFPHSSVGKESACNTGDLGLISGSGRSPEEGNGYPTPVFLPGKSHGQRSLEGYHPWCHKESDTTEQLTLFCLPAGAIINCADNTEAKICVLSLWRGSRDAEQTSCCWYGWHGDGHAQERQTRAQKEGTSSSGNVTTEVRLEKRRCGPLFWR